MWRPVFGQLSGHEAAQSSIGGRSPKQKASPARHGSLQASRGGVPSADHLHEGKDL